MLDFYARVDTSGVCWMWTGMQVAGGYGRFNSKISSERRVHRFAFELVNGPIRNGLVIDHLCRNRLCVNPRHLEQVTQAENLRRSPRFYTTHCRKGHELSGSNLRPPSPAQRGRGQCRKCLNAYHRQWAKRQRANIKQRQETNE